MSGDDLRDRAEKNAQGFVVPDGWGEEIELEVGDHFEGRYRGHSDEGRSGGWLLWDTDGELRFIWGNYRLDQGFENVNVGDRVVIFRAENYHTRFDDEGDATGLGHGVAAEPCGDPLPGASPAGDDIPF
jgi:hypothetical protein